MQVAFVRMITKHFAAVKDAIATPKSDEGKRLKTKSKQAPVNKVILELMRGSLVLWETDNKWNVINR